MRRSISEPLQFAYPSASSPRRSAESTSLRPTQDGRNRTRRHLALKFARSSDQTSRPSLGAGSTRPGKYAAKILSERTPNARALQQRQQKTPSDEAATRRQGAAGRRRSRFASPNPRKRPPSAFKAAPLTVRARACIQAASGHSSASRAAAVASTTRKRGATTSRPPSTTADGEKKKDKKKCARQRRRTKKNLEICGGRPSWFSSVSEAKGE